MFRRIKYFIQRGRRGYSDEDLWDFDSYLSSMIAPALRHLAKKSFGCPSDLYDKDKKNDECHRWKEILEEMAQGFDAVRSLKGTGILHYEKQDNGALKITVDENRQKNLSDKFNKGMQLFSQYFLGLWD